MYFNSPIMHVQIYTSHLVRASIPLAPPNSKLYINLSKRLIEARNGNT